MTRKTLLQSMFAVTLTVTLLAAALPVAVLAAPLDQPAAQGETLENWLMREKNVLDAQGKHLQEAHQVEQKTQDLIDKMTAEGKDASWLVTALAAFSQGVSTAESYYNQAAGILSTAAGFDGSGQVTDVRDATQTIRQAGHFLREAHLALTQATLDFREAVRAHAQ